MRIYLQAGGSKQFLLRVLGCALKADRHRWSFFLRRQSNRTKQKQSDTECARPFNHLAPRLTNTAQFSQ
jgi:hypothetical protein